MIALHQRTMQQTSAAPTCRLRHAARTASLFVAFLLVSIVAHAEPTPRVERIGDYVLAAHPRLIATDEAVSRVKTLAKDDESLASLIDWVIREAELLLDEPVVVPEMKGRRFLSTSKRVLERVTTLGVAYRFTGDRRYADRVTEELLNACGFESWNPSHMLDVAEMATAVGLGYDWVRDTMDEATRRRVVETLLRLGISHLSDEEAGWRRAEHNWNSVCHGGQVVAALAIADHDPRWAETALRHVKEFSPNTLEQYEPDGVYPEGPGYWRYGTAYQVILFDTLDTALGTDLGLLQRYPGFAKSFDFMRFAVAPDGLTFNFSDIGARPGLLPPLVWLARRSADSAAMLDLGRYAQHVIEDETDRERRYYPLSLFWWPGHKNPGGVKSADQPTSWLGRGPVDVAVFRGPWADPDAMYLAIKAGRGNLSHAHLDNGTFVFVADGVRWAIDLPNDSYNRIEQLGLNLWDRSQDGDRWSLRRNNNAWHNTLTLNEQRHRVDGQAEVVSFSPEVPGQTPGVAVVDLSATLGLPAGQATRKFTFDSSARRVVIEDHLSGLQPGQYLDWAMLTRADIERADTEAALVLRDGDRSMTIRCELPLDTQLITESASPPPGAPDSDNPGVMRVRVRQEADRRGEVRIRVTLQLPPKSAAHNGR